MTRTLIPAYPHWSSPAWPLIEAMPPGIAILNPASGPGTQRIIEWDIQSRRLVELGWDVAWYVPTGQLRRPLIDLTRDITLYRSWYRATGAQGIFWDEIPPPQPGVLEALLPLEQIATRLGGRCIVNPGAPVDHRWFGVLQDTIICTWEGFGTDYHPAPGAHEREAHLVHSCEGELKVAAPWGYATRDTFPNPWDQIASDSVWQG